MSDKILCRRDGRFVYLPALSLKEELILCSVSFTIGIVLGLIKVYLL